MSRRGWLAAGRVSVTAFLLATVAVVEAGVSDFEGLLGIPAGVSAGLVGATAVVAGYDRLGWRGRVPVDTAAGFGYGVVVGYPVVVAVTDPTAGLPVREMLAVAAVVGAVFAAAVSVVAETRQIRFRSTHAE